MRIPFLGPSKKDADKTQAGKKDAGKKQSAEKAPVKPTAPKKKAAAKKKKKKEKSPPPPKAPPSVGVTSGVSVNETWIGVFEKNEQVAAEERLTDEQISEFMKSEFPDVDAKLFDRVEIARGRYNRGGFHKKDKSGNVVRPKIHSTPHAPEGGSAEATRTLHPKADAAPKKEAVDRYQKDFKSHKK
ncbi:MAG: hypothetical protein ACYTGW_02090 [Planctomycetota bacterium]|jgi:hypothetical protein